MGTNKLDDGININDLVCVDPNQLNQNTIVNSTFAAPDMNVDGSLTVSGKLLVNDIEVIKSRIILNLDLEYIEEVLDRMDSDDLNYFLKHLHKLKLLTEKKLFDRS